MEIIESVGASRTIQLEGKAEALQVCLNTYKLFLEGSAIVEHDVNRERQGIPNGRAGRSEPTRAEYSADMWNTKLMCYIEAAESNAKEHKDERGTTDMKGLWHPSDLKVRRANF